MSNDAQELIRLGYRLRRESFALGTESARAHARKARRVFSQAVVLSRQSGARSQLIRALKGLGQIERDMGRPAAALLHYQEATALCRQEGDPLGLAHTVRHVADIHYELGQAPDAEPCYQEALAIYRKNEQTHPLDLANTVRPFAILKEDQGKDEEARSLWRQARDLYGQCGVQEGLAECEAHLDGLAQR